MKKMSIILLLIILLCGCNSIDNNSSVPSKNVESTIDNINETAIHNSVSSDTTQNAAETETDSEIPENALYKGKLGNTYGNIANGGYAALYGDYIYYANGGDTGDPVIVEYTG